MKMIYRIVIGLFLVGGISLASDLFVKEAEAHCTWRHMRHCFHGSDRPKYRGGVALTGQTLDLALNPISGATVNAHHKSRGTKDYATSDGNGTYNHTGLFSGVYDLKAARLSFSSPYFGTACNVTLNDGVNVVNIPMFGGKLKSNNDC